MKLKERLRINKIIYIENRIKKYNKYIIKVKEFIKKDKKTLKELKK